MANTRSAKKMVRKIARRTEINTARRSRMRSHGGPPRRRSRGSSPPPAAASSSAAALLLLHAGDAIDAGLDHAYRCPCGHTERRRHGGVGQAQARPWEEGR